MKPEVRYTDLPEDWHRIRKWGKLIEHEYSVKVSRRSRLRLKVCIFKDWKAMDDFFTRALGRPGSICRFTHGVCSKLDNYGTSYKTKIPQDFVVRDRKYFAMIGLLEKHLNMEVIIHEAVHAGIAYGSRCRSRRWTDPENHSDEELICYPAGYIASQLITQFQEEGLLQS